MTVRTVAGSAIFTTFVFVATAAFSAGIPATQGYFNVGEIMVYTTALLMGPYVGAFAGGVGSALSDALLAPQFAPGTLVIKATEGFIVGYLGNRALNRVTSREWKTIAVTLGIAVSAVVGYVGANYFSGSFQVVLGVPPYTSQVSWSFGVPGAFWLVLAALVLVLTVAAGLSIERRVGWLALSVLIGGSEMVLGYFLYERVVLGLVAAAVEIPFNIAQAVIGLIVALPLVGSVRRTGSKRAFETGIASDAGNH